ncbi:phosphocholine cytidylyltransferase family protein [Tumebacillus sp. ITR2]|uniref:Phosphocholine cytidylyltransferase family protein n=1 Tax=Tumebacillus amylolyticus TaxID=2801339 RepID=A0ABS1J8Q1_9BACL|nr:phosphocholine cytidylyltransferase family protein [Tumebacillus amylolyticus]MBL0386580.1 phosphocholine cytidylyltransferase family protein [Tumebacillus amylolyticus]
MKLVILVAGVGSRLRPLTDSKPKCLVEVGGKSILQRFLEGAEETRAFSEVVLITGYLQDQIAAFVEEWQKTHGTPVRLVHNERYDETNNGYTLLCAQEFLTDGFVLTDGDLLLDNEILSRVAAHPASHLAVDMQMKLDEEAMKFVLDENGHVTELSKEITVERGLGESIGLCKMNAEDVPGIIRHLAQLVEQGELNEYYERAFQELIREGWKLGVVDVGDLRWVEVDDHNDLERAQKFFA